MGRRSVWDVPPTPGPSLKGGGEEPKTVLEMLRAPAKKKDSREREKVASFYGIPGEVHEKVKRTAEDLGVPAGDVARLFFERGLDALESGQARLEGQLCEGRRTLFPTWGAKAVVGKKRTTKGTKNTKSGKVSYRGLPGELVRRVAAMAEKDHLAIGDVARWLLEWGLGEMEAGRLEVDVYSVETKYSLYGAS